MNGETNKRCQNFWTDESRTAHWCPNNNGKFLWISNSGTLYRIYLLKLLGWLWYGMCKCPFSQSLSLVWHRTVPKLNGQIISGKRVYRIGRNGICVSHRGRHHSHRRHQHPVSSIQYPASLRAEYWKFTNLLDWIDVCCGWPKQFVFAPKSSQIDEWKRGMHLRYIYIYIYKPGQLLQHYSVIENSSCIQCRLQII